jgi:hypothetical protein
VSVRALGALLFALALGLVACGRSTTEPPPTEEKLSVASGAPGAIGALAGGTDAAPPPPTRARRTWPVPGDEEEYPDPEELDAGSADAGLPDNSPQDVPL